MMIASSEMILDSSSTSASSLTTSTSSSVDHNPGLPVVYTVLEACVAIISVIGNLLVILVFLQDRRLRKVTNFYIISLSLADLLVGAIGIPSAIMTKIGMPRSSMQLCFIMLSLLIVLCTISILNLVAVSLDRYWAILHPLDYHKRISEKTAFVIICACWIIGAVIGFMPLFGWRNEYQDSCYFIPTMDYSFLLFLFFVTIVFPAFIMAFFYIRIYIVVVQQLSLNKVRHLNMNSETSASTTNFSNLLATTSNKCTKKMSSNSYADLSSHFRSVHHQHHHHHQHYHSDLDSQSIPTTPAPETPISNQSKIITNFDLRTKLRSNKYQITNHHHHNHPHNHNQRFILNSKLCTSDQNINKEKRSSITGCMDSSNDANLPSSHRITNNVVVCKNCQRWRSLFNLRKNTPPVNYQEHSGGLWIHNGGGSSKLMMLMNNNNSNNGKLSYSRREVKKAQKLFVIVVFFMICWIPLYTSNAIQAICPQCPTLSTNYLDYLIILSHINSAGSPFLYAFHMKDFRQALRRLIFKGAINQRKLRDLRREELFSVSGQHFQRGQSMTMSKDGQANGNGAANADAAAASLGTSDLVKPTTSRSSPTISNDNNIDDDTIDQHNQPQTQHNQQSNQNEQKLVETRIMTVVETSGNLITKNVNNNQAKIFYNKHNDGVDSMHSIACHKFNKTQNEQIIFKNIKHQHQKYLTVPICRKMNSSKTKPNEC